MGNTSEKKRIEYIDVTRGIAILLMINFHVLGETIITTHNFISCMIIEIFVVVSGYFFKGFSFKKNLQKMFVPFVITLVVVDLIWRIKNPSYIMPSVKNLLVQILCGHTVDEYWPGQSVYVGIIWFLPCLIAVRAIYALIKLLTKENLALRGVLSIAGTMFGIYFGEKYGKIIWNLDVALVCLVFFFVGEVFRENREKVEKLLSKIWLIPIAAILWYVLERLFDYSELPFRKYPYGFVFVLISIIAVSIVFMLGYQLEKINVISDILKYYGKYSFWVLVFHVIDKACITYPAGMNIYLLWIVETLVASIPLLVFVIRDFIRRYYAKRKTA